MALDQVVVMMMGLHGVRGARGASRAPAGTRTGPSCHCAQNIARGGQQASCHCAPSGPSCPTAPALATPPPHTHAQVGMHMDTTGWVGLDAFSELPSDEAQVWGGAHAKGGGGGGVRGGACAVGNGGRGAH